MNLTKLLTVLTKKTLIFSKTVDKNLTHILEFNVKNRIPMKTSWYINDLQIIFQKNIVICKDSTILTVFPKKTMIFSNMVD